MSEATLERVTEVPEPHQKDDVRVRAREMFGYGVGINRENELREVVAACDELGIRRPFTGESVGRYKAQKRHWHNPIAVTYVFALGATALVSAFAFFVSLIASLEGQDWWETAATTGCLSVVSLLSGLAVGFFFKLHKPERHWVQFSLSAAEEEIPEFALQTACDLSEELGRKYVFAIDCLREREKVVDPFLYVYRDAGRRHYLEVWNEPGFKQERME